MNQQVISQLYMENTDQIQKSISREVSILSSNRSEQKNLKISDESIQKHFQEPFDFNKRLTNFLKDTVVDK